MSEPKQFEQHTLNWFREGEELATQADRAPYEPFSSVALRVKLLAAGATLVALAVVVWIVS